MERRNVVRTVPVHRSAVDRIRTPGVPGGTEKTGKRKLERSLQVLRPNPNAHPGRIPRSEAFLEAARRVQEEEPIQSGGKDGTCCVEEWSSEISRVYAMCLSMLTEWYLFWNAHRLPKGNGQGYHRLERYASGRGKKWSGYEGQLPCDTGWGCTKSTEPSSTANTDVHSKQHESCNVRKRMARSSVCSPRFFDVWGNGTQHVHAQEWYVMDAIFVWVLFPKGGATVLDGRLLYSATR